jgi:hypothetical protein
VEVAEDKAVLAVLAVTVELAVLAVTADGLNIEVLLALLTVPVLVIGVVVQDGLRVSVHSVCQMVIIATVQLVHTHMVQILLVHGVINITIQLVVLAVLEEALAVLAEPVVLVV